MLNSTPARALAGATLLIMASPQAQACATCQCGDYTLTLIGVEKSFAGRVRLGVDYLSREEETGSGVGHETLTDNTFQLSASYSFTPDLSLALRLPYSKKESEGATLSHEEAAGLGDADLVAKLTLGRSGETSVRHLWGVQGGLRLPTSSEQKDAAGVPVSTDVQPGAGAWAPSVGVWYGYFRFPRMVYASLVATNGDGSGYQGLNPGAALLGTLSGQYALSQQWSLQLGLESRWSGHNRFNGVEDADSGGVAAFIVPGLMWSPMTDVLVHIAGQLPVLDRLNGEQKERGDIRVGIAFDLPN